MSIKRVEKGLAYLEGVYEEARKRFSLLTWRVSMKRLEKDLAYLEGVFEEAIKRFSLPGGCLWWGGGWGM